MAVMYGMMTDTGDNSPLGDELILLFKVILGKHCGCTYHHQLYRFLTGADVPHLRISGLSRLK
jgi:hypothetical protein